ncbi:MAG: SpaH/EbpB family LPXTG-anchored major pilin, partial [Lachnospiraceae bacterium]|nr:SpaH/EbpB family LPXTG-anchored major pilin [Lachnospiraceae bacterium]
MKQSFKKMYMFVLALCMCVGLMGGTALADEPGANDENVCAIGEVGYPTLAAAVEAANATVEADTITMLKDIEFDFTEALTIMYDTTIEGGYTISRGNYTGTMFTVSTGACLTLSNITVDGNNNWIFKETEFMAFVENGTKCPANSYYATNEDGAPVATDPMIVVNGIAILGDKATIQNNAGDSLFFVKNGGKLETLEGSVITHNTKDGDSIVAEVEKGGRWDIKGGIISDTVGRHHGVVGSIYGELYMYGGEIFETYGSDTNGAVFEVRNYMELNGGEIYHNYALYSPANSNNAAIYVYNDGVFVMNGGKLWENYGSQPTGIVSNFGNKNSQPNTILNGGQIIDGGSFTNSKGHDLSMVNPVKITNDMIVGESRFFNDVIIENGKALNANDVYFHGWIVSEIGTQDYTGGGTINADITLYSGAEVVHHEGTWNGFVTVDAIGTGTTLTVKPGATIKGIQVRVLDSVKSGNYLYAEEAAAAQAASYVEEDGANVISPVLFYHRLTPAQQNKIVVTFDYNGGLDAQNWSGCQMTSAEAFAPACPAPEKAGYKLAGWKYAVDNAPESLSMEGAEDYKGEEITTSLRLIAQWDRDPSSDRTLTFVKNAKVTENGEEVLYPLMGIEFDIYYLCSVEEYNAALVAKTITENTKVSELPFTRTYVATAITDAAGHAMYNLTENGQPDGIYVIEEKEHDAIVAPVEAFLVAVPMANDEEGHEGEPKYNIELKMKNEVVRPEVDKDVTAIDQKEDSADMGETVTWIIRGDVPKDLANAFSYVLTDVIDYRLTYKGNVVVNLEDATGAAEAVVLDPATDYKLTETVGSVTVNGEAEEITTIQVELLEAGRAKIAELSGASYANFEVRVYFDTCIDEDAVMGEEIPNTVTLKYTNSANFDWSVVPEEDPEVYTTGIHVHKYDAKDVNKALAGAVFKLAEVVDKETEGAAALVIKNAAGAVETVYVVYKEFYVDAACTIKANTITTDENGDALIFGLEAGTYYLVETKAPAGYNLLSYPVQVTLDQTSHHTGDIETTQIVEIDRTVYVANSNTFRLPETGGIGTAVFTLVGSLMMGGAGVMLVNK